MKELYPAGRVGIVVEEVEKGMCSRECVISTVPQALTRTAVLIVDWGI